MTYEKAKKSSKDMLDDEIVLVIGWAGSLGHQVIEWILETANSRETIIFSRDEKKQFDMCNEFQNNDKLTIIIGVVLTVQAFEIVARTGIWATNMTLGAAMVAMLLCVTALILYAIAQMMGARGV